MGSIGDQGPAEYVDSVIAGASPDADAKHNGGYEGPISEPLVMDFAAMHDSLNATKPPTTLSPSKTNGSWLSDEDTAAPPDIAVRRDMSHHVPLRTRLVDYLMSLQA